MAPSKNAAPGFAKRPDYEISILPAAGRMQALFHGKVIADSTAALQMDEENHAPVLYFPRADVRMERLARTDHDSFCPFKGHASYWTVAAGGTAAENAAWSYETPYDEVGAIKDHIAFYPDKVTVKRV